MLDRTILSAAFLSLAGCATVDSEPEKTSYPSIVQCDTAPLSSTTAACEVVSPGDGSMMITGTILGTDQVWVDGAVLIDADGMIVAVGCNVGEDPRSSGAIVLACPNGIVSPGFINPHDHIGYNHRPPSKFTDERYSHRHQWRLGLEGHTQPDYERAELREQVAWGEMRHALSGTTSIAGMGGVPGMVRNLEDDQLNGELRRPAAFATVFPLGDASGTMLAGGCAYPELVDPELFAKAGSFQAHVAEGVDSRAANEIACLTGQGEGSIDVTESPSAFVHFVAASAGDAALLSDRDVSLIWSPRSNIALYGHTASVTMFDSLGVNIALSTDWLPSGSMNMLRELRCAADFSGQYLDGYFSDFELWKMVTVNAARSFALQDELGSIAPGYLADISIFRDGPEIDPFADIVASNSGDVLLVLRAGTPVAGRAEILAALNADCDTLPHDLACGELTAVCLDKETGGNLELLLTANRDSYGLMSCGATPGNEPTCVPSWPGEFDGVLRSHSDADGDGVANEVDNCPKVFNPPRPMDGGLQPDWDKDEIGDACDKNPIKSDR